MATNDVNLMKPKCGRPDAACRRSIILMFAVLDIAYVCFRLYCCLKTSETQLVFIFTYLFIIMHETIQHDSANYELSPALRAGTASIPAGTHDALGYT